MGLAGLCYSKARGSHSTFLKLHTGFCEHAGVAHMVISHFELVWFPALSKRNKSPAAMH